jgi:hypothetical protein
MGVSELTGISDFGGMGNKKIQAPLSSPKNIDVNSIMMKSTPLNRGQSYSLLSIDKSRRLNLVNAVSIGTIL